MDDTLVFIDAENTTLSLRKYHRCLFDAREVIAKAGGWCRIRDVVAYADFSRVPEAIARHFGRSGVRCRHVPRTNGSKDLVDLTLSLEMVLAAVTEPEIRHVVLVAGDADYIPAVSLVQQAQKAVSLLAVEGALSRELGEMVAGHVDLLKGGAPLRNMEELAV